MRSPCAIWSWSSRCFLPSGIREASLLACWTSTKPAWAAACCGQRLLRPSLDRAEIEARLDAVEELLAETMTRAELRKTTGRDVGSGTAAGQA
jgi:DNA mismatch repair ATPase MutS